MNKFYIQIVFFLLIIPLYMNNKTLATELSPKKDTKHKSKKNKKRYTYDNTQEIYEKNKHLLYTDIKETKNACKVMKEALRQLEYHVTNTVDYGLYNIYYTDYMLFDDIKYQYNTNVEKKQYIVDNPNKYNKIINKYWNPDHANLFNDDNVKRKIVRVYNPNLVIIQQRSKTWPWSREKYFYAIAAKFKISENKIIIVMSSANINDNNCKNKRNFENIIVKNANLFEANIDSEDDIRNGKLKKIFVNLSGHIIEKKTDRIYVTYFESISGW
ncbi:fam-a protein [Plasmodium yoelii]|uniref:Fam-a protein n=2 Tax=Plasmodium yoelii TaxID=5861 RepID=A0AAF0B584_PLAYO|nr:fam-a protein [Plasmodium yoelii]WBY55163.1 fam-a protein [Plasmodium yoelii yoelii]WBY57045.1 fam-a protein [Plasmodium yoelii yoelii]VTZ72785.1 fam-a protein [Plasmodium yoelii]|eukprot:XP_034493370.1 fam-a protein [Plasmodium yoelii]